MGYGNTPYGTVVGSLSERDFTWRGATHTVQVVMSRVDGDMLGFQVSGDLGDYGSLALRLGTETVLSLSAADRMGAAFVWSTPPPFADGDTVGVCLSESGAVR